MHRVARSSEVSRLCRSLSSKATGGTEDSDSSHIRLILGLVGGNVTLESELLAMDTLLRHGKLGAVTGNAWATVTGGATESE